MYSDLIAKAIEILDREGQCNIRALFDKVINELQLDLSIDETKSKYSKFYMHISMDVNKFSYSTENQMVDLASHHTFNENHHISESKATSPKVKFNISIREGNMQNDKCLRYLSYYHTNMFNICYDCQNFLNFKYDKDLTESSKNNQMSIYKECLLPECYSIWLLNNHNFLNKKNEKYYNKISDDFKRIEEEYSAVKKYEVDSKRKRLVFIKQDDNTYVYIGVFAYVPEESSEKLSVHKFIEEDFVPDNLH